MIDTPAALEQLVASLAQADTVAIDMEADSMHHYREQVCLLQIATDRINAIIDPLAVPDLAALRPMFASPRVRKVFHGADYDVRSLYRDFAFDVRNLYDTQIACQFLGYAETGLDAVLTSHFGISLDKRFQRRDWSRRPLPPEMLDYAAKDAVYLIPLARELEAELVRQDRQEWVAEECKLLSRVRPACHDNEPHFLRFRGAGRLKPRQLAILEELLEFRHQVARRKDRPLFKVFSNQSLLKVVQARPVDADQLQRSGALSKKQFNMYAEGFVQAVARALAQPDVDLPVYPRKRSPSVPAAVPQRVQRLKAWRERCAQQLNIDPGLLCNKALITGLAVAAPRTLTELTGIDGLKNWQRRAFGRQIIETLQNRKKR